MKLKLIVSSLLAVGVMTPYPLAFGAAKDLTSATTPADKDFPKVGGNLGNQNYSSLTQINKSNVKALGAVWRTHISQAPTTTPVPAAGQRRHGPADLGARGRRRDLHRHARSAASPPSTARPAP